MGRPAFQDNWRAEEELAVPEFPMKDADGSPKRWVSNQNICG